MKKNDLDTNEVDMDENLEEPNEETPAWKQQTDEYPATLSSACFNSTVRMQDDHACLMRYVQ